MWRRRSPSEGEFQQEIEAHIAIEVDRLMAEGLSPDEAERAARVSFGNVTRSREQHRESRRLGWLDDLARDLRYAARGLARSPGFIVVAALSLAIGIGANTALLGAAYRGLLAKLDVERPDELVTLHWRGHNVAAVRSSGYGYWSDGGSQQAARSFSGEAFRVFRERTRSLSSVFAFAPLNVEISLGGQTEFVRTQGVSGTYYQTLGIGAQLGRTLDASDESEANPVAVIGEAYWNRRFGGAPSVVGTALTVNGHALTIVGVVPDTPGDLFRPGGRPFDLTVPLAIEPLLGGDDARFSNASDWWLLVMGRLAPGATLPQVRAELEPMLHQVAGEPEHPRADLGPLELIVRPGAYGVYEIEPEATMGLALFGAVFGLVLVIVVVNLSTVLLVRGEARHRELFVRSAIGASRGRIVRQLLTESLMMTSVGGGLSLLVSFALTRGLATLDRQLGASGFDAPTVLIACVLTMVAGLSIGLLPAARMVSAVRLAGGDVGSARHTAMPRLGGSLVVAQVALSLVVLVCAGLLVRTLVNLRNAPSGFDADHLVFFRLDLGSDARTSATRLEHVIDRLELLPDVRSVTVGSPSLMADSRSSGRVTLEDGTLTESIAAFTVHPGYFETLGISVLAGRPFTMTDYESGPPAVIVNESFARRFFGEASPLKHTIRAGGVSPDPIPIVGVVADVKYSSLRDRGLPIWYQVHRRTGHRVSTFYVRTSRDPELLVPSIRQTIRDVDPAQPELSILLQRDAIARTYLKELVFATVSGLFGALVLLLSTIGVFGLMAFTVARRTKEFGIRMALGAEPRAILLSVVRRTLVLTALGCAVGLAVAVATTRYLESFLFDLSPVDPLAIAGAMLLLVSVASLAGLLPARRAARVDPVAALRAE